MTELLINGQRVVLPYNFSTTIIDENPFFTKNGKYSLGIEILFKGEPENKKIYKHLDRFNTVNEIPKDRSAILIVDNEVVLNGTEDILEFSNERVKIQILSGNSDLNFLIGGDFQLRSLNMGSATPFNSDKVDPGENQMDVSRQVFNALRLSYPARDWHLLPFYTGEDMRGDINATFWYPHGNFYFLEPNWMDDIVLGQSYDSRFVPAYSGQVPQPYLCFIIKKVFEILGYSLTENALAEHPVLKDAYIVHGMQTLEYAKMLPVWTVTEFLSKIELQFDCTFVVDTDTRIARLLFNYQNNIDRQSGEVYTPVALDEFTVEHDEDNKLFVQNSNVAYSLDSDDYYKFMNIDPRFITQVKNNNFLIEYNTLSEMVSMVENTNDVNRFKKIWTDKYDMFIAYDTGRTINGQAEVIPRRIHSFGPLMNNPDSEDIDQEFDIIPASMIINRTATTMEWDPAWMQMAIAGSFDPLYIDGSTEGDEEFNLQSLIEGESSLPDEVSYSKMRLAIYSGISELDTVNVRSRYPISYVESLAEYFEESKIERYFGPIGGDPFRLSNLNRDIYSETQKTDTTNTYKVPFVSKGKVNLMSVFVIKNKAFRCVKIERTVSNRGFNSISRGEFYPVYQNSTEV